MFQIQTVPPPWIDREDEDCKDSCHSTSEDSDFVPYTVRTGVIVLGVFFVTLIVIMVIRGVVPNLPTLFRFFGNIFLAGTIICGISPLLSGLT
jgi:hypothetical protein